MQSLLLLLSRRRGVLLKGCVGNLQAHQGTEADIKNSNEEESGDKGHKKTYQRLAHGDGIAFETN